MATTSITLDQNLDFVHSTLQHIQQKEPAYTFTYRKYGMMDAFWEKRKRVQGGKEIEGHIVLGDEGNAKHSGLWDEDTHNVVNITKKYTVDWVHATTNFSYNEIEVSLNNGPEQVYNTLKTKYNNMCREIADKIFLAIFRAPTSSSDKLNPLGIPSWIRLGTSNSTGGWTGYKPRYNDGSTPGTAFNITGISDCSATVNSRFASYYADHNGDLNDSLLVLLDRACRKLHFSGPSVPKRLDLNSPGWKPTFSLYSTDNLIGNLNQTYAKSDDQMGARINTHYNVPHFREMPFEYVDILDTANTSLFGTDPIFGVNHDLLYPVVHTDYNFNITKPMNRAAGNQHLVNSVYCDVQYAIFSENPPECGFLISEHPS